MVFYQSEPPERIPLEVWKHFRDVRQIKRLGGPSGVKIEVLDHPWKYTKSERGAYFEYVVKKVFRTAREPMIVFLDPDTGLGRDKKTTKEHVCPTELGTLFDVMQKRGCLVFYQHAQRRKDWRQVTRKRFASAIGLSPEDVRPEFSEVAKDVILFVVHKK